MNFFDYQNQARQNTYRLVFLFLVAVVLVVSAVTLVTLAIAHEVRISFHGHLRYHANFQTRGQRLSRTFSPNDSRYQLPNFFDPHLILWSVLATLAIVLGGTIQQMLQLREGGSAVAGMVGARALRPDTTIAEERQLLHVVEEMAIAAGIPVPAVYLIPHEEGINAFAAGFSPMHATVTVSQGCLRTLTRDELQGVIGHEFSHILNGDMTLNLRLLGLLTGITWIGIFGLGILRGISRTSRVSLRLGLPTLIAVLWASLIAAIGYIGVFFARLIKCAVNREREFLADASAVQFTRNPDGICGALKKILGCENASYLHHCNAEHLSHFFLAEPIKASFRWFETHPPLLKRIRRIEPSYVPGQYDPPVKASSPGLQTTQPSGRHENLIPMVAAIGTFNEQHLAFGKDFISGLPDDILGAVRAPARARLVVLALLLSDVTATRDLQLETVKDSEFTKELLDYHSKLRKFERRRWLPLVGLAVPALRTLPKGERESFLRSVDQLVHADRRKGLFEFCLQTILQKQLLTAGAIGIIRYTKLPSVISSCRAVLTFLAKCSRGNPAGTQLAFQAGMSRLTETNDKSRIGDVTIGELKVAFTVLGQMSPSLKSLFLSACTACVIVDNEITIEEFEALRTICTVLDCPMPPRVEPGYEFPRAATHPA